MTHLWVRLATLVVITAGLGGCGGRGSSASTVSVTCGGQIALAGAQSVEVSGDSRGGAVLQFPDPVNAGHTGQIPVPPGTRCTVAPTPLIRS